MSHFPQVKPRHARRDACQGLPVRMVVLAGSIGAAAMAQRRCQEHPVSNQEFLTIAKIVI